MDSPAAFEQLKFGGKAVWFGQLDAGCTLQLNRDLKILHLPFCPAHVYFMCVPVALYNSRCELRNHFVRVGCTALASRLPIGNSSSGTQGSLQLVSLSF